MRQPPGQPTISKVLFIFKQQSPQLKYKVIIPRIWGICNSLSIFAEVLSQMFFRSHAFSAVSAPVCETNARRFP